MVVTYELVVRLKENCGSDLLVVVICQTVSSVPDLKVFSLLPIEIRVIFVLDFVQ